MQYIACKFRPADTRTFTYHYDGVEPLKVGDMVKVPDPRSADGWKRVHVAELDVEKPTKFDTKPILGLCNPDVEPDEAPAPAAANPLDDDKILF